MVLRMNNLFQLMNTLDEGRIEGIITTLEFQGVQKENLGKSVQDILLSLSWKQDKIEYWLGVYDLMNGYWDKWGKY